MQINFGLNHALALVLFASPAALLAADDVAGAETLLREGKYQAAEKMLRGMTSNDAETGKVNYLLGVSLLEQQKFDESEPYLKKAVTMDSAEIGKAKVALSRVELQKKQPAEALKLLNEAEAASADTPDVYLYRGIAYANLSKYPEAVGDLEKAIQADPQQPMPHYYAGLAYNGLKRPDKMVENFQIFLKLAPDAPEAPRVRSLLRGVR